MGVAWRAALGCACVGSLAVAAVLESQAPDPRTSFDAVASLTLVPVTATAGGRPVRDLAPGELEVSVDGEPVPVELAVKAPIRTVVVADVSMSARRYSWGIARVVEAEVESGLENGCTAVVTFAARIRAWGWRADAARAFVANPRTWPEVDGSVLVDAIRHAADLLSATRGCGPESPALPSVDRVVFVTDGEDVTSDARGGDVARDAAIAGISLDAVLLGVNRPTWPMLVNMSDATAGTVRLLRPWATTAETLALLRDPRAGLVLGLALAPSDTPRPCADVHITSSRPEARVLVRRQPWMGPEGCAARR